MTVKITKPEITSLREKLNELEFGKLPLDKIPAGSVVQIVSKQEGDQDHFTTSSSYQDIIDVEITPKFKNSKILVWYTGSEQMYGNNTSSSWGGTLHLFRGDTNLFGHTSTGDFESNAGSTQYLSFPVSKKYVDTPNTTETITYTAKHKITNGARIGTLQDANIVCMEIKQ